MADNSAQEQELSLDEELTEKLQEIEARESETETDQSTETESEQSQESTETAESEGESESAETETAEESESETKEETSKTEPRHPPGSWSAQAKAEFNKLPDHIQDEVLKREDDFHKGLEGYKTKAQIGEAMQQVLQPYEPYLRSKGANPTDVVASMLNTAYTLENASAEEKPQIFAQVAQQFGVDLSKLQQGQTQQKDPYIQQLEQQIQQLQQQFQSQTQAAQQQSMTEAHGSIDAFRNETDEQGQIKHLYFDDVRDDMADMIESAERKGKTLSLQDAYDAAVWARPDIRNSLLTAQQQEAEEKRKADAAQKAAEAKKRASVNVPTTGSHASDTTSPTGSIEDTIRSTYEEIQARNE